jgi:hypothetical protein
MTLEEILLINGFTENEYVLFKDENIEEYVNQKYYLQRIKEKNYKKLKNNDDLADVDYFRLVERNKFSTWDDTKNVLHIWGIHNLKFTLIKE